MRRSNAPADAGCWMDRTNGWQLHCQIAQLALSLGWLTSTEPDISQVPATPGSSRAQARARRAHVGTILAAYQRGDNNARCRTAETSTLSGPIRSHQGICDLATRYLNTLAPEGHTFGWHHGQLLLMTDHEWAQAQGKVTGDDTSPMGLEGTMAIHLFDDEIRDAY